MVHHVVRHKLERVVLVANLSRMGRFAQAHPDIKSQFVFKVIVDHVITLLQKEDEVHINMLPRPLPHFWFALPASLPAQPPFSIAAGDRLLTLPLGTLSAAPP